MKVIIIESDHTNNGKNRDSEKLYNQLKKKGIDVHIIECNTQFKTKPLSKKQQSKYFIS